MSETQTAPVTAPVVTAIIAGNFSGAFSPFQRNAYYDLIQFGLDKGVAHKVATDFGSDIGNAMRNSTDFAAKVGKAKKDGETAIKFSGKGKEYMTYSMSVIRVAQTLQGLAKEGLIESASMKPEHFTAGLQSYLQDAVQWASEQTWKK